MLKSIREGNFNDQIYLDLSEKGEALIDKELEYGMSKIAKKLYGIVDEERVKLKRLNNARFLLEELSKIGIEPLLPLTDNHIPLFVPIVLNNRDAVRKAMFEKDVFCPIHWPLEGLDVHRGKVMAKTELSLIIDQRYGQQDMLLIASLLSK